jgi:hypothetical protein
MDMEILARPVHQLHPPRKFSARDKKFAATSPPRAPRLAPLQIGSAGQLQEWLEDWDTERARTFIIATSRISTDCIPAARLTATPRRNSPPP